MRKRPDAGFSGLTIRGIETKAVRVPLTFPLGTSAAIVEEAPLLLVDLQTEEGVVGRSYLFCYTPSGARAIAAHLHEAIALVRGQSVAPRPIAHGLARRFALLGLTGTVRMALAALDVALWDALAISRQLPLASLLGARPRRVRAYNSCGLGLMPPEAAANEAEALLDRGFTAVKLRLGHATLDQDLLVTRSVRRRLPDHVAIMVDYNQALTVAEALLRGHALQQEASTGWRSRRVMTIFAATRPLRVSSDCRCRSGRTSTGPRTCSMPSRLMPAIS